ncbi:hypothetical protein ACFYXC_34320 [Streptomyces sp. NPDC002701]|uniref:hypothetical protein n=1 Tax=Streptomyces sp. NPDC002701 TaxID=3364661 RepID=UPI0036936CA1
MRERAGSWLLEICTARGAGFGLVATPFSSAPLLGADPAPADDPRVTAVMPPWDAVLVRHAAGGR